MPTCKITYTDLNGEDREADGFEMMMAFESGELDEDGIVALFQHLVNTGMAWQLQGFYGRTAMSLIDAGLVQAPSQFASA